MHEIPKKFSFPLEQLPRDRFNRMEYRWGIVETKGEILSRDGFYQISIERKRSILEHG